MSKRGKLQGGSSELTKLKALWLTWANSPDYRAYWRHQLQSQTTQAANRELLRDQTGVELKYDSQLTEFRDWMEEQDALDQEAERQRLEAAHIEQEHPDWSADQLREEVIRRSLLRAIASGQFGALGLKAVAAGQREKQHTLERDKFELLEKKAALADAAKDVVQSSLSIEEQNRRLREILK